MIFNTHGIFQQSAFVACSMTAFASWDKFQLIFMSGGPTSSLKKDVIHCTLFCMVTPCQFIVTSEMRYSRDMVESLEHLQNSVFMLKSTLIIVYQMNHGLVTKDLFFCYMTGLKEFCRKFKF